MDRADASPARLYRRLLRLYPSAFRARYEDEMVRLFEDQLRDVRAAGEPAGIARLWLRVLGDLAVTAASERAGRDRTVAHSLSTAPSTSSRVLGLLGVVGGLLLVAAFVPGLPWTQELTQLRLVAFNVGAIAIATAVHRRQVPVAPRASLVAAGAVALANAWYLAMIVLSIGRPVFPDPDPEFRQVAFWAGVAMWWADAAFGIFTWRLRSATRLGAGALLSMGRNSRVAGR